MTDEIEDAEIIEEPGTEVAVYEPSVHPTLFGTDDPNVAIARMVGHADALKRVIYQKNLYKPIQGKDHVLVEGWELLGAMVGVFPVVVWSKQVLDEQGKPYGWEARVEARTRSGEVVGAAEAQCLRSEDLWSFNPTDRNGKPIKARDDHALRSMAQTRAISKALRSALGFIMSLAGFEATPEAEMPAGGSEKAQERPKASQAAPASPRTGESFSGGEYVITFGKKHNGKRIVDVEQDDPQYLDWLCKVVDPKGPMVEAKAAALAWLEEKQALEQVPFS